jgi:hypothetical protein
MSETTCSTPSSWGDFLISLGIALVIFSIIGGGTGFWTADGLRIIPSTGIGLGLGGVMAITGLLLSGFRISTLPANGFLLGILAVFCSEWLLRSFNLLQGPTIRGEIIFCGIIAYLLLRYRSTRLLSVCCYLIPPLLVFCFSVTANGRLLFTDDHATFFYRLALLKENFPSIPFYSPHWNGGFDARDFFATGALNFFFLSSPLLYLFPLEQIYNILVLGILFGILPVSCYLAARIEGLPSPAPALIVALSVTTSLAWYRWALHYGTMGFVTSASLMPLNLALASRVLSKDGELSFGLALLFFASTTLMLFWSPSGIAFVPVLILGAVQLPRYLKKRFVKPLLLGLLAVNIPWILIFWSASKVSSYLGSGTAARVVIDAPASDTPSGEALKEPVSEHGHADTRSFAERIDLRESLKALRELGNSSQPLLFFLFLPGLFVLGRGTRLSYFLTFCWMLFLGTFCVPLVPKLDLDRMLVFFTLCATIPSGALLANLFQSAEKQNPLARILIALAFGFLLAGVLSSGAILRNRSMVRYWFAGDTVQEMREAIQTYSRGGRILYSGFVLHELNSAHLAPLAHLTETPLIASSYVHRHWRYTEILPHEFLARISSGGVEQYLNLYNVSAVFAHERKWREYFEKRPELYEKVWHSGRFTLYLRKQFQSSYILHGKGELLSQTSNHLTVRIDSEEATLKFTYFPFLQSSSCTLQSKSPSPSVEFIHLTGCTAGEVVKIHSKGPFSRIR